MSPLEQAKKTLAQLANLAGDAFPQQRDSYRAQISALDALIAERDAIKARVEKAEADLVTTHQELLEATDRCTDLELTRKEFDALLAERDALKARVEKAEADPEHMALFTGYERQILNQSKELAALRTERDDLKQALEIATRSADDQMHQKRRAEAECDALRKALEPLAVIHDEEPGWSDSHLILVSLGDLRRAHAALHGTQEQPKPFDTLAQDPVPVPAQVQQTINDKFFDLLEQPKQTTAADLVRKQSERALETAKMLREGQERKLRPCIGCRKHLTDLCDYLHHLPGDKALDRCFHPRDGAEKGQP